MRGIVILSFLLFLWQLTPITWCYQKVVSTRKLKLTRGHLKHWATINRIEKVRHLALACLHDRTIFPSANVVQPRLFVRWLFGHQAASWYKVSVHWVGVKPMTSPWPLGQVNEYLQIKGNSLLYIWLYFFTFECTLMREKFYGSCKQCSINAESMGRQRHKCRCDKIVDGDQK